MVIYNIHVCTNINIKIKKGKQNYLAVIISKLNEYREISCVRVEDTVSKRVMPNQIRSHLVATPSRDKNNLRM